MNLVIQCIAILLGIGVIGVVALVVYQILTDIVYEVNEKLRAKNVTVSSTGVKVGIKKRDRERYLDSVQRQFVSAWNKSQTLGESSLSHRYVLIDTGYQGSWLFGSKKSTDDAPKRVATPSSGSKKGQ